MIENTPTNAGGTRDVGSIPGLGRSPGGGNGNLLQCLFLDNSMEREPGGATKSPTYLSPFILMYLLVGNQARGMKFIVM